jgi:uncharacterized metal-binding protein YceD (DUF177 family)
MDKHLSIATEFSRIVAVDRLEQGEFAETLVAREDERRALAARFDLIAIESLRAEISLRCVGHGPVVRLEGRIFADVVQTCVVSLEPVVSRIEEDFVLHFAPERRGESHGHIVEEDGEADDADLPEPLVDGRIDVGEAIAQQLALALDPYPRKPGVRIEDVIEPGKKGISVDEPRENPFAALARLSRRDS